MLKGKQGSATGWAGLFVVFALLILCHSSASGQAEAAAQPQPLTKAQLDRLIYSIKGPDLYRAHCAPCHGTEGKGDGPMVAVMKMKVPDLTVMAKNNAGQFPAANVRKMITGQDVLLSHGSREMPIWGPIFHQIEDDKDFGNVRVENLVKYLQSIQQK
jgi:mono/diheme cytochrome c family protein